MFYIVFNGDTMKDSKYYKRKLSKLSVNGNSWLSKLLITIIIVLVCLIVCNFNDELRDSFVKEVLEDNMKFSNFNKLYKKFMIDSNESIVVNDTVIDVSDMEEVDGRYRFNYGIDYQVETLQSGIIVYIGDKDNLGNTVIVQGNDGIDVWYSGITLKEYGLYDYVSKGDILGLSSDVYVTISIYEDGELLKYEEYI